MARSKKQKVENIEPEVQEQVKEVETHKGRQLRKRKSLSQTMPSKR